jgi:Holliday junction resolvase RusA-like endonuclease
VSAPSAVPTVDGLRFVVWGVPKPKGSLRHVGNGRLKEQLEGSAPWREAVKYAGLEAVRGREGTGTPFATLSGPIEVDVVFTFPRPQSAPKRRRIWPVTRRSGDLDKLQRNVLDAIVDAGLIEDDSQVVRLVGEKTYPDEHPAALPRPGARILVRTLPAAAREVLL